MNPLYTVDREGIEWEISAITSKTKMKDFGKNFFTLGPVEVNSNFFLYKY